LPLGSSTELTNIVWEFNNTEMPKWLALFAESRVKSLDEMVKWNEEHKEFAMPERKQLYAYRHVF
jgi:hypothetical protein